MSVKTLTHTFSTVAGSGGTASANLTIDADNIAILFVKVEPSIGGGTADFEIFQKDTLLSADLSYKAAGFTGDFFDPVEDVSGTPTERTEGFVTAYQDDDGSLELHIQVTNDDSSTKDFDITIRYTSAGDIDVLGTPVDNQIAVWKDKNTLEGDVNLTWDGTTLLLGATRKLKLPQEDDATSPTISFGDGNTGFYESADNKIRVAIAGGQRYGFSTTGFAELANANSFLLVSEISSSTNPVYAFGGDLDTGMGRAAADILSLITGGVEAINVDASQAVVNRVSSGLSNTAEGGTAQLVLKTAHETHTLSLSTTSVTTTLAIPSGARLLGASFNVNTAVTDDGGDDTWSAAFSGGSTTALATAEAAAQDTKVDTQIVDELATATTEITFTPHGGSFSTGIIEIVVYYEVLTSLANV